MEVETDAVPSPARTAEQINSGQQEQELSQEKDAGIPRLTTDPLSETKFQEDIQEASPDPDPKLTSRSSSRSSTSQDRPKVHTNRSKPARVQKSIIVQNSTGVHIGSNNVWNLHSNGSQKTENKSEMEKFPKEFRKLLNSTNCVEGRDLVIVSQCVDMAGLEILSKELGIEEVDLNRIKHDYGDKGLSEVAIQALELWSADAKCEKNQAAMLNILCDKLSLVLKNGGKKALRALYKLHFSSSTD